MRISGVMTCAEGRGDRPGRSRIFRDFTLARARAEPLAPKQKGRLRRSEAKASRQSRDRSKRHPQEGQHSAAAWRDPGPSASGERHVSARRDRSRRPRRSVAARFTRARCGRCRARPVQCIPRMGSSYPSRLFRKHFFKPSDKDGPLVRRQLVEILLAPADGGKLGRIW